MRAKALLLLFFAVLMMACHQVRGHSRKTKTLRPWVIRPASESLVVQKGSTTAFWLVLSRIGTTCHAAKEACGLAIEAVERGSLRGIRLWYRAYERRVSWKIGMWQERAEIWVDATRLKTKVKRDIPFDIPIVSDALFKMWWESTLELCRATSLLLDEVCLPLAAIVLMDRFM